MKIIRNKLVIQLDIDNLLQHKQILALLGEAPWEDQIKVVRRTKPDHHVQHLILQLLYEEPNNVPIFTNQYSQSQVTNLSNQIIPCEISCGWKIRRLTATNSSRTVLSNWFIADSGAIRGLPNAPEKPAEWIASRIRLSGLLEICKISAFTFCSCT